VTICNTDLEEAQKIMLDRVKHEAMRKAHEKEQDRVYQVNMTDAHYKFAQAEREMKERRRLDLEDGLKNQIYEKRMIDEKNAKAEVRQDAKLVGRPLKIETGLAGKTQKARGLESPTKLR